VNSVHTIATLKLGLRAAWPPMRRQAKRSPPIPVGKRASGRVCGVRARCWGRGSATHRTFRSSEAPAWPPARRAAGWGRRRQRGGDLETPHGNGCFSRPRARGKGSRADPHSVWGQHDEHLKTRNEIFILSSLQSETESPLKPTSSWHIGSHRRFFIRVNGILSSI
jgi:hypothetical protein